MGSIMLMSVLLNTCCLLVGLQYMRWCVCVCARIRFFVFWESSKSRLLRLYLQKSELTPKILKSFTTKTSQSKPSNL